MRLRADERLSPVSPTLLAPIAPRLELPSGLAQAAMALKCRDKATMFLSAGLEHDRTEIVGLKQDPDLHLDGGGELPHELGGQRGGFTARDAHDRTHLLCNIEPDPQGMTYCRKSRVPQT